MTLAIETGVQNVTLAIFLTLTVLGSLPLAVTQNIYGVVMILNASSADPLVARPDRAKRRRGSHDLVRLRRGGRAAASL